MAVKVTKKGSETVSAAMLLKQFQKGSLSWRHPSYQAWRSMLNRCYRPADASYATHGGRGIEVCSRWFSFENFVEDMGERPAGLTLERKDTDRGYGPDNCVWASMQTQQRNRRNNRVIEFQGEAKCLAEWAEDLGLTHHALQRRLGAHGWSVEKALTTPKIERNPYHGG